MPVPPMPRTVPGAPKHVPRMSETHHVVKQSLLSKAPYGKDSVFWKMAELNNNNSSGSTEGLGILWNSGTHLGGSPGKHSA